MPSGGKRRGSGRTSLPDHEKKQRYTVKVSPEIKLLLEKQKNASKLVEDLLRDYFLKNNIEIIASVSRENISPEQADIIFQRMFLDDDNYHVFPVEDSIERMDNEETEAIYNRKTKEFKITSKTLNTSKLASYLSNKKRSKKRENIMSDAAKIKQVWGKYFSNNPNREQAVTFLSDNTSNPNRYFVRSELAKILNVSEHEDFITFVCPDGIENDRSHLLCVIGFEELHRERN
jgi:hypothetical protein